MGDSAVIMEPTHRPVASTDGLLSRGGGEWPDWLTQLRERGAEVHRRLGLPTTKDEEWKYTSLRDLAEMRLTPSPEESAAWQDRWSYGLAEPIRIAFVNGRFDLDLTTPLREVPGLEIRALECAAREKPEWLRERIGHVADMNAFTFAALNTASFEGGAVVHVGPGTQVERPIVILHLMTTASGELVPATSPRNLIVVEPGARAFILEAYASVGDDRSWTTAVTEAIVHEGGSLEHVRLQDQNVRAYHISLTQVRQEARSAYNSYNICYGGKLTRNDWNVFLAGEEGHCRMDGVVALGHGQHTDNHTRLDHAFARCDSFEVYKHVLASGSRAVFNGKIYVHQDAQKTDAKQTNQTLLLAPDAEIDSKPQLEIFADDVRCTHGATVGQVRQDALFYLRSRGIDAAAAQGLLVYAFAAEVLEKITREDMRECLEQLLLDKLRS